MTSSQCDRDLLFALLAYQNDFISRERLLAAVEIWQQDESKSLANILFDQKDIDENEQQLLSALLKVHLRRHQDDPQRSLASLSSIGSLRQELKKLGDSRLEATLSHVASDRADSAELEATLDGAHVDAARKRPRTSAGARFRILRPHAKGGLGEVSVAQDTEVNREVALKEIRTQFADDPGSRSRFVLEAEVTGGLEHPGIVPVYGLGQYADGRPYYAMRFVRGDSLKEAVDQFHRNGKRGDAKHVSPLRDSERSLQLRQLLGRFVDVCNAIEFAHSRGVLHRDLKPGNIMLGKYGETLVVDWGLAKLMGREETNKSTEEPPLTPSSGGSSATRMGSAIGTPAYMPPEQAAGEIDKVGAASDVYSLGATLYYLLTGRQPIEAESVAEVLERVQSGRFPAPRTIRPAIPQSLEAICLRAMSTNPADRYDSPQSLADEVERFLADEPVSAHAEPVAIRARRWMRKHPRIVTAVAATLLVGLTSTFAVVGVVSSKNKELARTNADLKTANELGNTRFAQLENVNDTLASIFRDLDPMAEEKGGLPIRAQLGQSLDKASQLLDDQSIGDPLMSAALQLTLAKAQRRLRNFEMALRLAKQALALTESELGADHQDTLTAMVELGDVHASKGDFDEAIPLQERAYKRRLGVLGAEHRDTLYSQSRLAASYGGAGQMQKGLKLQNDALQKFERILGRDHKLTVDCLALLSNQTWSFGEDILLAEKQMEDLIARRTKQLGAEHYSTLVAAGNLAVVSMELKKFEKARRLLNETRERIVKNVGPNHPTAIGVAGNLAFCYLESGETEKGLELLEQTVQRLTNKLGAEHPETLTYMNSLAYNFEQDGQLEKAIELHEKTFRIREKSLGLDHMDTLVSQSNLGWCLRRIGRYDESIVHYGNAVEGLKKNAGAEHPETLGCINNYGRVLLEAKKFKEAEPVLSDLLATLQAKSPNKWSTFRVRYRLGAALLGLRRFDEAEVHLLAGYHGMKPHEEEELSSDFVASIASLVHLFKTRMAEGDIQKAEHWEMTLLAAEKDGE